METSRMLVLAGLWDIEEQYQDIVCEHSYCTTETEKFERALARLIRAVEQDDD